MLNCCLVSLWMLAQFTPSNTGELRVSVIDQSGLPVQSSVELVSHANQVRRTLQSDVQGQVIAKQLPFGTYEIQVTHEGFAPFSGLLEIRSATPTSYSVTLGLAVVIGQSPRDDFYPACRRLADHCAMVVFRSRRLPGRQDANQVGGGSYARGVLS